MIVNIVSSTDDEGVPINGLIVAMTVEDLVEIVTAMQAGADVIDLPSISLDALLEGTGTDGRINHLRFLAVRDDETLKIAMAEELTEAGCEDYEYDEHGVAPDGGITEGWKSPLQEDIASEIDQLDDPAFFENWRTND